MRKYYVILVVVGIIMLLSSCSTSDIKTAFKSDMVTHIEMPEPFDQTMLAVILFMIIIANMFLNSEI